MNIIKRHHGNTFPNVMDEIFKDWMGGSQLVSRQLPPVNIKESDAHFTVEVVAPGFKKEDFNVEVENGQLIISAKIKAESTEAKPEENKAKFTRKEFTTAAFKRAFTLPETVNEDSIGAVYDAGILTLTLPKIEKEQPKAKRLIEIS